MANFFGLFDKDKDVDVDVELTEDVETTDRDKLRLREEQLDVSKRTVQTGEVKLRKDIIEEQQTVNVPVSHDEVVIERRTFTGEPTDEAVGGEETIRIPVSEERVNVDKHTVVTGEVSAKKRVIEETEQVKDTLKREKASVELKGDTRVVDEDKVKI
ncbi:MAG TPA: YsnF/AvaK domain-containing protein [Bacilli bacterium]